MLGGPQPVYLSNLAACLLKLDHWDLADSAATRALVYDPKHVKALYRRALARRDLGRLNAALADLEWLLTIDKFNRPALEEKLAIRKLLDLAGSVDWPGDESIRSVRNADVAMDVGDESDSEDFAHAGTNIVCRYYNTSDTGCFYGDTCRFRHAPDSKSVRDELWVPHMASYWFDSRVTDRTRIRRGRNVCVYWLLGHCRFAEAGKCVYAHDATYLPERGWWRDTARLERVRADFDAAVCAEPLDLGAGRVEERILAEAFVPPPWRKDLWVVASFDVEEVPFGSEEGSEDQFYDGLFHGAGYGWEDYEEGGGFNEFGFRDADVEEMWEYGIKPWEDGAYVRALALFEGRLLIVLLTYRAWIGPTGGDDERPTCFGWLLLVGGMVVDVGVLK